MKREIFVCDHCGTSAEKPEEVKKLDLGRIILGFDVTHSSFSGARIRVPHTMWDRQWCLECRTKLGCLEPEIRKAERESAPVTPLEDLVREIIREEIANLTGAQ